MNILHISLIISLASLGVRAVTDKGMIFYFLRKPFDTMQERRKDIHGTIVKNMGNIQYITDRYRFDSFKLMSYTFILYLMKPVFMCSTCMASLHTLIWFPILTGELFTYKLILAMLIVSIFNTIGWLLVSVLRNHLKE